MRWLLYGSFALSCGITSLFGATIEPGDSSKRHKTDYVTDWTAEDTQTYTVSASASGCSFVDSKTKASEDATLKSHSSSSASAEKSIIHTDKPNTSGFGFSVSGVLAGSGDGGEVTWSATLQQRFFWLEASPSDIVKAGTAVTITANGSPTESTWTVNNTAWKNGGSDPVKTSSITLNRNMWDKMQWTPNPVPEGYLFPPAGTYTIAATTTEEKDARSAGIVIYEVELKDVRVRPSGSSSSQNVIVKTGDKVNISVTASHTKINDKDLPFRWSIQQMQNSGSFGSWSELTEGNDKASFEYTTAAGGIFRVKVELELDNNMKISEELKRQSDCQYESGLKKGAPDAFGVCDTDFQIESRGSASSKLGSTAFAYAVAANHSHGLTASNFAADTWKCNLFVCVCNHLVSGNKVPLINGGVLGVHTSPPTANQWSDGSAIANWINTSLPQPGYVWAKHAPGATGHCGIVDYDGQVISAGTHTVNRKIKHSGESLRKYTGN